MVLIGFALAGWEGVEVKGEVAGDFHAIEVAAACSVQLEAGESHELTFTYSAEGASHPVSVTVADGTLLVLGEGAYRDCVIEGTYRKIDTLHLGNAATVRLSKLEGMALTVDAKGASTLEVAMVKTKNLVLRAESASTITLQEGSTQTLTAHADGASSIAMAGVRSESAKVTSTASSAVDVSCAVRLEARATGSSAITYLGGATDRVAKADVTSTISKKDQGSPSSRLK